MASGINIGLTLSAIDKASPIIGKVLEGIKNLTNAPIRIGAATTLVGHSLQNFAQNHQDTAMSLIKPFVTLEDARTQLENTLMKRNGKVSSWFAAINKEATALGDKLPGTTADFYQMASAMKTLGVGDETIAKGGLKSAAYLANVLKLPYDQAATSIAKFKNALGIADKDLVGFADDIQRLGHMGVKTEEMQYAFSRSAGALKQLGIQGLQATRGLTPLFGLLVQSGWSGETTGTAIGNALQTALTFEIDTSKPINDIKEMLKQEKIVFDFVDDKGVFKGAENFMAQLQKLEKLNPDKQAQVLKMMFGKGAEGDGLALLLKNGGVKGLDEFKRKMAEQANLNQRVQNSLGTLGALWEAFGGTMQNVLAGITEAWGPELKSATRWLSEMTSSLGKFFKAHTTITKVVGFFAVGMPIIAGAIGLVLAPLGLLITGFGILKKITGFNAVKTALMGVGKSACSAGACAGGASGKFGALRRSISGIGALGFAQIAGITALGAAFVGLNLQIAKMGKANIDSKHIASMTPAQLKENRAYLNQRLINSKKPLTTLDGAYERIWQGTDDAEKKQLQALQVANNRRLAPILAKEAKAHKQVVQTNHTTIKQTIVVSQKMTQAEIDKITKEAYRRRDEHLKNTSIKGGN